METTVIKGIDGETMTVRELIQALHEMPYNAAVSTEGCDCYGDAAKVKLDKDGKSVTILRCAE